MSKNIKVEFTEENIKDTLEQFNIPATEENVNIFINKFENMIISSMARRGNQVIHELMQDHENSFNYYPVKRPKVLEYLKEEEFNKCSTCETKFDLENEENLVDYGRAFVTYECPNCGELIESKDLTKTFADI